MSTDALKPSYIYFVKIPDATGYLDDSPLTIWEILLELVGIRYIAEFPLLGDDLAFLRLISHKGAY
jgi:hypothetical protein